MKPRILILSAGYGEGHNAAARALLAAACSAHGADSARMADVFALARPRFNRLTRDAYRVLIDRAPGVWRSLYRWIDRAPAPACNARLLRRESAALRHLVDSYRPTVICSTYPLYGCILDGLDGIRVPRFVVVTDSISINSLWWRTAADGWFVPNADSVDVLLERGVPRDKLHVLGFPVSPRFDVPMIEAGRPPLAGPSDARVLMMVNSRQPRALAMARHLLSGGRWTLTCAVSHDERARRELASLAARGHRDSRVLGWTDDIPDLLRNHHVVISKAGGATTQEALAAECPMIVNQVIPGQEEGNAELLRRHRIGARVETPAELDRVLEQAFARGGAQWAEWRQAAAQLARPDAARRIVECLAESISNPVTEQAAAMPRRIAS